MKLMRRVALGGILAALAAPAWAEAPATGDAAGAAVADTTNAQQDGAPGLPQPTQGIPSRNFEGKGKADTLLPTPPLRRKPDPLALPPTAGQGPRIGRYFAIRYNDQYPLNDSEIPFGFLKNIPIAGDDVRLSISGMERATSVYQTYGSYTGAGEKNQWFQLLRHEVDADLTIGDYVRVFADVVSGQQFGTNYRRPAAARLHDDLDLSQGFVELHAPALEGVMGVRVGRQQIHFGSGQLLAVQMAANVMRNYDGIRAFYYAPKLRVDVFAMRPVEQLQGVFDDRTDDTIGLWGAYVSTPLLRQANVSLNIDAFYVGDRDTSISINQLAGRERRHTAGTRLWGRAGKLRVDSAFMYQAGRFNEKDISASSGQLMLTLPVTKSANPFELEFQADYASGGPRTGQTLRTFNPLYAANEYIVLNAFLSMSNIVDVSPGVMVPIGKNAGLELVNRWYWRYSVKDAVYGQGFSTLAPSLKTDTRYTGMQPSADLVWTVTDNFQARLSAAYFKASRGLRDVGFKDGGTVRAEFTFTY